MALSDYAATDPRIADILLSVKVSDREAARLLAEYMTERYGQTTSRTAVQRARRKLAKERIGATDEPRIQVEAVGSGSISNFNPTSGEGEVTNFVTDTPIVAESDWSIIFEKFGLDPAAFEIVEDTVRMSTWQQSKRTESGDRDVVDLYSYSARFRRRSRAVMDSVDVDRIIAQAWARPPAKISLTEATGEPCTFVVAWADLQIGKDEGGGVAATTERFLSALDRTVERIEELRAAGRNIEEIAILNMGDPIEGCSGHYAQQSFVTQLNLRDQLTLVLNLFTKGFRTLEALAPTVTFASVLCNHGEWQRHGGKSVTDDADNAGGFIAETLKTIIESGTTDLSRYTWAIPRDEMVLPITLSGVPVALTHGHTMPQSSDNIKGENQWLQNQSMGLLHHKGVAPRLWVTAHRHHSMVLDFGPWWRIQCSSLDGGSKWFYDSSGKWASHGVTTFLVGNHDPRGYSDYLVI